MKTYVIWGHNKPVVCETLDTANKKFDAIIKDHIDKGYTPEFAGDKHYMIVNRQAIRHADFRHPRYMVCYGLTLSEIDSLV